MLMNNVLSRESEMPKLFSKALRPKGWHETVIRGDLITTLTWRERIGTKKSGWKNVKVP